MIAKPAYSIADLDSGFAGHKHLAGARLELHLDTSADFTRRGYGKKVKSIGGSWRAARGHVTKRVSTVPVSVDGLRLAAELLTEFPSYNRSHCIIRLKNGECFQFDVMHSRDDTPLLQLRQNLTKCWSDANSSSTPLGKQLARRDEADKRDEERNKAIREARELRNRARAALGLEAEDGGFGSMGAEVAEAVLKLVAERDEAVEALKERKKNADLRALANAGYERKKREDKEALEQRVADLEEENGQLKCNVAALERLGDAKERMQASDNGSIFAESILGRIDELTTQLGKVQDLVDELGETAKPSLHPSCVGMFVRPSERVEGAFDLLRVEDGDRVTRLEFTGLGIWPVVELDDDGDFVTSAHSASYEHPKGLVLLPDDVERLGLTVEGC